MKQRIGLIALAAALLLGGGCSAMLERSYVSSNAHVDYSAVEEDPSVLRAETYQSLVNSILYFVENHAATGTIRLYNYTGDVEADLANACTEILNEDPLGAYAVRDIRYDTARIITYYEVSLSVIYSRSAEEAADIRNVTGLTGLRRELVEMIRQFQSQGAVRMGYFSWNEQYLEELFWQIYYNQPLYAVGDTQVSFTLYPGSGTQRIIEVTISWPQGQQLLRERVQRLGAAADALLAEQPPAGQARTVEELARILAGRASYDAAGSVDPEDALAGLPAGELGILLGMELLCQRDGLEAALVLGTLGQSRCCWLIAESGEGYRHLLPGDLTAMMESELQELPLYTDAQLQEMGYSWQASLYPACEA